jgi:hypothetical protein
MIYFPYIINQGLIRAILGAIVIVKVSVMVKVRVIIDKRNLIKK